MTQVLAALMCLVQGVRGPGMERRSVLIQSLSSFEPPSIKSHRNKRSSELLELESKSRWGANSTDCEEKFSSTFARVKCKIRANSTDAEEKFSSLSTFEPIMVFWI